MLLFRLGLTLAAAILPTAVQALQSADGFAAHEDFETYDLGPRSIDFCPGFPGFDNFGYDC